MPTPEWLASLRVRSKRHGIRIGKMFKFRRRSLQDEVLEGYEPHEPELDPPFQVIEPGRLSLPLVFSSPHSGNVYPRRFLEWARLDEAALRRSGDAFVDDLFGGVTGLGAPLIKARFPRAYLDLNREPYELDPTMFEGTLPPFANTRSLRVAGGLGTIARVAAQAQEIYARRLPVGEAIARIDKLYKPYHTCLGRLIQRAQRLFGVAVLVDCHSMPSTVWRPGQAPLGDFAPPPQRPEIVLGDRFGTSCAADFVDAAEEELGGLGYTVRRNKPYAGGYITETYGKPMHGCHAMQIEICRALYMDESELRPNDNFGTIAADLIKAAAALAHTAAAHNGRHRPAAE